MRCLGIAIKKNEIYYAVVEGESMETAFIYDIGKQNYRFNSPELMLDFQNIFVELLTKYAPQRVAYKLYLDSHLDQISYMLYSLGILELTCSQRGIKTRARSNRWITASKKIKIKRLGEYFCNQKFNSDEAAATLVAWYEVGE